MPEFKIHQLFPISVYENNINVDKNLLSHFKNLKYNLMNSKNGKFTENKNILDDIECIELKLQIKEHLNLYLKNYFGVEGKIDFYLQNSWVNKHNNKDWAQSHFHHNSLISGVYYLQTFEDSGDITFFKPNGYTNMFHSSIDIKFNKNESYNSDNYTIKPTNGMILLFPSHLYHSVGKNLNENDRYSLAFNFFVEGEINKQDNTVDDLYIGR